MKLKDLKIGAQLRLGLGALLALVVLLGALAWMQNNELVLQTKGLYDHPLQVRRVLSDIQVQILTMHRDMKDLCLVESGRERDSLVQDLDVREVDIHRQFTVLYGHYLGPRADVEQTEQAFVQWKTLRDETIRLLKEGKTAEAISLVRPDGASGSQVEKILSEIKAISEFAKNKGDQFYAASEQLKNTLAYQLGSVVVVILLLSLLVTWLLLNGIKAPLEKLTATVEQFRQGRLDVRSPPLAANEFGVLASSFNTMADSIQTEMRSTESASHLAGIMLGEEEAHAFCRVVLQALVQQAGAQVSAIYILNDAKSAFEHFESIGLGAGGRSAFSAAEREGELGAAVATRLIQHIKDIPSDTRFTFAAVSGTFMPREILTIPVLSDKAVVAVISLASVSAFSEAALRLVNDIWSMLNARVNGVLAFRKVKDLAVRLEQQNSEMGAQARELAAQADELTEQNTELELQKRQLDEVSRMKSAFLSNMSHELRTPLNSVIALSGVLSRRLAKAIPEEEYSYLEIIERNGKNLLALINDILDLSRIEAGHSDINLSRFSVREVVGEVVAMLETQAQEKGISLTHSVGEDLPPVTSDPDKFRHILQNLVGNAVKFTEQGQVVVTARRSDLEMYVAVRDTGIGIAADQLPFIFDEFRQADSSTSRKYGGTGLGLAIAKEHARLLGGDLTAESVLGQGSTFTLRLPLAVETPHLAQAMEAGSFPGESAARPTPVPAGQGQRLLLVEDNEPAIIQLTDILHAAGYCVQVARNGKEALAQIGQGVPDAMILDLMMPEVDGFQVLKAIREVQHTAQLPVLILTAKHVTKEELSFLKSNHVHQLIQKGDINKDGLLVAVAQMVVPLQPKAALPQRLRPVRSGKPLILVVEDNPDNLRTIKVLLSDCFQVVEAEDGRAGVEQARAHRPDLILTDIALPVMDGFSVLAAIRDDEALRRIPVIAVTASAMKGNREEILAHGFDGYISKPIDHDVLMKTLRAFLEWEDAG
jgi:signal transduction histidine kinase/DNA-binding response OmpR family regulator/HAMP domain-containing protein